MFNVTNFSDTLDITLRHIFDPFPIIILVLQMATFFDARVQEQLLPRISECWWYLFDFNWSGEQSVKITLKLSCPCISQSTSAAQSPSSTVVNATNSGGTTSGEQKTGLLIITAKQLNKPNAPDEDV